ncbi:glycosyltransferase family 10 domain-containing protein [Helicobacter sp. MIT 14-3879]|uniref:glycosyltransferase family 10 domain-containing protein n=1 Tax=Helicobacter sp. MIT 14-3879 TaxID=2040649 RepID=UPI000E1EAE77|nr:glycosyltransferase family 10 [Helicobacter sp. MIT 14-3879]RDU65517.1 alpha-1,3-fucosyl transferase [Helicobacter sp. MIT 14-3879]
MKKDIRIACIDGVSYDDIDFLKSILGDKFNFIVDEISPDYVIYSVFGTKHIKYDCIRIFYTVENCRADFNFCDYAITFDYLNFEDRHFRYPYYLRDSNFSKLSFNKSNLGNEFANRKFCSFVVSNGKADEKRNETFIELNKYKKIDSGGKYKNNIGFYVKDKIDFLSSYKFNLCFENSYTNGYVTEKIIHAKVANSIPIYWGGVNSNYSKDSKDDMWGGVNMESCYKVSDFNPKAFINLVNFRDIKEMIDFIKYLDNDKKAYLEMLNEPLIKDKNHKENFDKNLAIFLSNIFNKPLNLAYRRGFGQWRMNIENRYKKFQKARDLIIKLTNIYRNMIYLRFFKK